MHSFYKKVRAFYEKIPIFHHFFVAFAHQTYHFTPNPALQNQRLANFFKKSEKTLAFSNKRFKL